MNLTTVQISSAVELDALVGQRITDEDPEIYWEDSHGQFQFATEAEARRALMDPYYQRFLPDVDWSTTVIREVRAYHRYCADPDRIWTVIDKASTRWGAMFIWREFGRWRVAFGSNPSEDARTPAVAICLAALRAAGVLFEVHHDRIDSQISQYRLQTQPHSESARIDGSMRF
jgi:hypothetical protein